jgi:hypothetical protein
MFINSVNFPLLLLLIFFSKYFLGALLLKLVQYYNKSWVWLAQVTLVERWLELRFPRCSAA